jgi:UrcA family protein
MDRWSLSMQRALFVTFAAALMLSALHPAYADETTSTRVSVAGIDTSTQQGADQVLRRIRHAARDVCDVRTGVEPTVERRVEQECMRNTMNRSVAALNDANVSQRHAQANAQVFASR